MDNIIMTNIVIIINCLLPIAHCLLIAPNTAGGQAQQGLHGVAEGDPVRDALSGGRLLQCLPHELPFLTTHGARAAQCSLGWDSRQCVPPIQLHGQPQWMAWHVNATLSGLALLCCILGTRSNHPWVCPRLWCAHHDGHPEWCSRWRWWWWAEPECCFATTEVTHMSFVFGLYHQMRIQCVVLTEFN